MIVLTAFFTVHAQFQLSIVNSVMVKDMGQVAIFSNGELNTIYNDTIYNE
jgi:hypothetical protein